mmetsp:Transcript_168663/g.536328  ORF Transcript_168663/g.536328 Transcript_168663/m.536328 type:complete len:212 (-) Transcript_168663:232-867(-)
MWDALCRAASCSMRWADAAVRSGRVLSSEHASMRKSAGFTSSRHFKAVLSWTHRTASAIGPPYTKCPSDNRSKWLNDSKISRRGWWIEQRTVQPRPVCLSNKSTTNPALLESNPEVGSSTHRRDVFRSSRMAKLTRRRSPPDMPGPEACPTGVSAQSHKHKSSNKESTTAAVFATRRNAAAKNSVSRTVSSGSKSSCCGRYPTAPASPPPS